MRKIYFFVSLFFATVMVVCAQDTMSVPKLDSAVYAKQTLDLLAREQMMRYSDSLERLRIQYEIENTSEVKKRKALEAQLDARRKTDSVAMAVLQQRIEESKSNAKGYPIVVASDTIRVIYAGFGSFTAQERAENSTEIIENISAQFISAIDTLVLVSGEQNVEIVFQDRVLTTITQTDALWQGSEPMVMAVQVRDRILVAIGKYQDMRSVMTILKQIFVTLLVIVACFVLIRLVNRSFRHKLKKFLLGKQGTWFKGWTVKDSELLSPKQQIRFVIVVTRGLRWTLNVLILYIALPIIFSLFPFTERFAVTLFDWILNPVKSIFMAVVGYLPNLGVILVIYFTMKYVVRGVRYLMKGIETGKIKISGFYPDWAPATYNILRILLYAFSFVLMFNYLPYSDSKVFQGVSVFLGIIFSLGSSSAISNIVAGLVITYMRPFKVGDHIRIAETTGDVIEKTPFVTRIRTHKQEIVTIPNGSILSASVVNYSTSATDANGIIFHVTITIGYDVPWRKVHEMMIEAAGRSEYILETPAPFVLQTSLDDFYVSYQLCAYSRNPEKQATIYSQLNQNIQDVFNENDIEIMSPHYRAERDGNCTTVPENFRAKDYTVPAFRITKEDKQ